MGLVLTPPVVTSDDDPKIADAIARIYNDYGDRVSVARKAKSLLKFGRSGTGNTSGSKFTISTFQGSETNETFATTNSVDSIVSTEADTATVTVEGHTRSGNDFTFVSQSKALNGTTPASLDTPLTRCTRIYNPSADLAGTISVYDSTIATTAPSGVPSDATATKCVISAGRNQSEKCATALSSTDYWIVTSVLVSMARSSPKDATLDADVEYRQIGGVFRPLGLEITIDQTVDNAQLIAIEPYAIIPKNSDVKLAGIADVSSLIVTGHINGYLAGVI